MADADSLIEGKGTVKKNIHLFVGALIAIVIVIAIFAQDASSKKNKAEKAKVPEKIAQADMNPAGIKGALELQKTTAIPNAAVVAGDKPGVPGIATEGVGLTAKQTEAISVKEQQAIDDARREAQLNGSSILAISTEATAFEKFNAGNNPYSEAPKRVDVNESDLKKAMAGPVGEPEAVQIQKTLNKDDPSQSWQAALSNRKKTEAIVEDIANSPYTIFEGAVIPAVLMTKVNSQLPGQVTALVSQDVYDGVTGRYLIIPKGSMCYGTYNNNVVQGQSRLMVAFTRLILPNGRSVSLQGMPAADKSGQHGIEGDVNNHYLERFGISMMTAVLGTIVDNRNSGSTTVINTGTGGSGVTTAAGTVLVEMSRAEQQRTAQIKPTVVLTQGEKFNINVNRDISIEPYR